MPHVVEEGGGESEVEDPDDIPMPDLKKDAWKKLMVSTLVMDETGLDSGR